MADVKRKWDLLTKERREGIIREVSTYFKTEKDIDLGLIACEDVLDFFIQELGEDFYNKGLSDATNAIKQNMENLEVDLSLLKQK